MNNSDHMCSILLGSKYFIQLSQTYVVLNKISIQCIINKC